MRARLRADARRAAAEAEAHAAHAHTQAQRAPVDLRAEEHFPGLGGASLSAAAGPAGGPSWGGRAAGQRGWQASGEFPVLGADHSAPPLSKGQRKKLNKKAKRCADEQHRMGDEAGMPPAHVMAAGVADAAPTRGAPNVGSSDTSPASGVPLLLLLSIYAATWLAACSFCLRCIVPCGSGFLAVCTHMPPQHACCMKWISCAEVELDIHRYAFTSNRHTQRVRLEAGSTVAWT